MLPGKLVPKFCGDSGRLFGQVVPKHLFTKIEFLAIHFDFFVEIDVDGTVIRALYRWLDVAVLYPRE